MAKEQNTEKVKKGKEEKQQTVESKTSGKVQEKGSVPRLALQYKKDIVNTLVKRFNYRNVIQAPKLEKISVNVGVGQATQDPKLLEASVKEIEIITGQKAQMRLAKKAISNFKLRAGVPIGARVTLRGSKMYEFLDRLITIALPRVRDFRGVSDKSFDGHGNYTLGIKEQIIFPEIDVDKVSRITGMDITLVTTAKTDIEAYELLKELGMPFVKRQEIVQTTTANKEN